jgi:uncharacterized protein (TIGR03790 family)
MNAIIHKSRATGPNGVVVGLQTVIFWLVCVLAAPLWGGGSGLNVVVIVNQSSRNSVQLGNYYCERRQVPPQNVLRINWPGPNTEWALSDFTSVLFNPLLAMLAGRQLTNQIDYVVLSMDIPYQVSSPGSSALNSTTSSLFYGFKPDPNRPCSLASGSANLYAGSESVFRATPPINAASNSFLATMITSSNLALAMQIVDQGAGSDSTFPTQTVYLQKSTDFARNVRYVAFDNAIFETRLRGNYSMVRTNDSSIGGYGYILGAQTGSAGYAVAGVSFAPGGIADNLTSFGGIILQYSGQLDILSLLAAGAAGSYGTVAEPCNYLEKFPSPLDYFYQARGFSLAECYYQSLTNPYQGLIIGEPLAAPFALPAAGAWNNLPQDALLTGTTNLTLEFDASNAGGLPLQQVDLFVDGLFVETLTNLPPSPNNILTVTLNGHSFNYTVPANATINSLAAGLARVLNNAQNTTRVAAYPVADRIELRSTYLSRTASQLGLAASATDSAGDALTTFLTPDSAGFLDSVAHGIQYFSVTNNLNPGDYLQLDVTKTNGALVSVAVTNNSAGGALISSLLRSLVGLINATPGLQGSDGVVAEGFYPGDVNGNLPQFNLLARSPGWNAAQLQARLSGSSTLAFSPSGTQKLDPNLPDLQPRAHLYLTAGATSLPLAFTLDTTTLADGFHELTAVAYEGSNVRTQTRVAQTVCVSNTPLSAVLTLLSFDATNVAVEAVLPFSVVANSTNVATIQLFSTGGSLGAVAGQSSATFSVSGTNLDVGLHPFYALVSASNGGQYRTQTKWIRLLGPDAPFTISLTTPPPRLAWPATAGRSYDILSAPDPASPFHLDATAAPISPFGLWTDTTGIGTQQFYRVRTSQ